MNPLPTLCVYSPDRGNGIIYGLQSRPGGFVINSFLNDPFARSEYGFKGFFSYLRGIQDYKNPDGHLGFYMNLRHEFCEKGFAFPPEDDYEDENGRYGTRLRAYALPWTERTMIFLDGLVKVIPPGSESGAWQDHEHLRAKISPLIDIFYAIKDGLREQDFFQIHGKPGFYDEDLKLKDTIELKRYVQHGQRLSCDRDSA